MGQFEQIGAPGWLTGCDDTYGESWGLSDSPWPEYSRRGRSTMRASMLSSIRRAVTTGALAVVIGGISLALAPAGQTGGAICKGEVATIVGTEGDDVLQGSASPDVIAGLGGNDVIRGLSGRDLICGGGGDDGIYGDDDPDRLYGGAGADDIGAGSAEHGGGVIVGGRGPDVLRGSTAPDRIFGKAGDDVLSGFSFDDRLFGGGGEDTADGGDDTDRCVAETVLNCEETPAESSRAAISVSVHTRSATPAAIAGVVG